MQWLCSVWNVLVYPKNFPTYFFAFVSIIISIVSLRYSWKAVTSVEKFEKRRLDLNFYNTFVIFLNRLKLTIWQNKNNVFPYIRYFYSQNNDLKSNGYDSYQIEMLRNLAKDFLHYLSTENGQIPLSMNKEEFHKWNDMREKLTAFLDSALSLGERLDYNEENFRKTLAEIHDIIDYITTKAKKVMDDIMKENS
jgi:hypothetical protein